MAGNLIRVVNKAEKDALTNQFWKKKIVSSLDKTSRNSL